MSAPVENARGWSATPVWSPPTARARSRLTALWPAAVIGLLALALWFPRLRGPIDLRYDSGVYFLLGVSLAEGHGYRIASEPGNPAAVQYPPLLPVIVAAHAKIFGATDPIELGRWLRRTYFVLFLGYAVSVLALARRFAPPFWATLATALCLAQLNTVLLSDLLFTELPFALITVLFVLIQTADSDRLSDRSREALSFVLACAAFFLRTAGIALLAAWIVEAALRRRWRLAFLRAGLALVPFVAWQAYVAQVHSSFEYAHPAYAYQRAPYQFYNVTYAENLALRDPFQPELGHATAGDLGRRFLANVAVIPSALGEAVSSTFGFWRWGLNDLQDTLSDKRPIPEAIARWPLWALAAVVIAGLIALTRRGAWTVPLVALGSIALICSTPWPGQFSRYLSPLTPLLTLAFVVGGLWIHAAAQRRGSAARVSCLSAFIALGVLTVATQIFTVTRIFQRRNEDPAMSVIGSSLGHRMFYHDHTWAAWEKAASWIQAHARPDAIIATTSPHLLYLETGLKAVFPPMEANPAVCRQLLDSVAASFVIIDELEFLDIARRYAAPALNEPASGWTLVYQVDGTRVYQRQPKL